MESIVIDNRHLIRINRGEEIVESLTNYIQANNITAGAISGIGAASQITLRYYSLEDKQYHSRDFTGEFEIASLSGNVSLLDEKPWPHLHIVLGDTNYQCFGGHLEAATVGVTCEVIIDTLPTTIERELDEETGLKLWKF